MLLAIGLALAGCAGQAVDLTDGGGRVRVMESRMDAANCELLKEFRMGPRDIRGDVKLQRLTLARNHVAEMGGNAVLPGEMSTEALMLTQQHFSAYRCP
jgi:hypothetical protein